MDDLLEQFNATAVVAAAAATTDAAGVSVCLWQRESCRGRSRVPQTLTVPTCLPVRLSVCLSVQGKAAAADGGALESLYAQFLAGAQTIEATDASPRSAGSPVMPTDSDSEVSLSRARSPSLARSLNGMVCVCARARLWPGCLEPSAVSRRRVAPRVPAGRLRLHLEGGCDRPLELRPAEPKYRAYVPRR